MTGSCLAVLKGNGSRKKSNAASTFHKDGSRSILASMAPTLPFFSSRRRQKPLRHVLVQRAADRDLIA